MAVNAAVLGSKGRKHRALSLICLFTAQILALTLLASCGDGEVVMAMRDLLSTVRP